MTPDTPSPAVPPETQKPFANFEGYPVFYGHWLVAMAWKPDTESAAALYQAEVSATRH